MAVSRYASVTELDNALLVLRRLWRRPEIKRYMGAKLDHSIQLDDYRMLNAIQRAPDGLSVGDLAKVLHVDSSTGSRLVERMVNRGYVHRTGDTVDRRRSTLSLTASGWSALASLQRVRVEALSEMTQGWRVSEISGLARLVHRLDEAAADLVPDTDEARSPEATTTGADGLAADRHGG